MQHLRRHVARLCVRSIQQVAIDGPVQQLHARPSFLASIAQAGQSQHRHFSSTNYTSASFSDWIPTSWFSRKQPNAETNDLSENAVEFPEQPASEAASDAAILAQADQVVDLASNAELDALASAAEGAWPNTVLVEKVLVMAHTSLGLPWWEAMAIGTFTIRTLTLPLAIYTMKQSHKLSKAQPEMQQLVEWMKEQQLKGQYDHTDFLARRKHIFKKHDTSALAPFIGPFFNGVIFLSFYRAIFNFADAKVPSLMQEGPSFAVDLAAADPTYILPILCGLSFLINAEFGSADVSEGQTPEMQQRMKMIMRAVAVLIPIFASGLPAGLFVYWVSSNVFSLFLSIALSRPAVRSFLGLPPRNVAAAAAAAPPTSLFNPAAAWPFEGKTAATGNETPLKVKTFRKPPVPRRKVPNR